MAHPDTETPMSIAQSFLPEFDHEMATTRTLLERVPADKAAWKPHPKSTGLGRLAMHIAELPQWVSGTLRQTELDVHPVDGPGFVATPFSSTPALLQTFDANAKAAREVLAATADPDFFVPWSLKNAGKVQFTMPRVAVLRGFVLNHIVHHRGQLSVYLRLNDVPLPSIYGPTADT
jgi:uncharacterized damage-inducible protein DinB